MIQETKLKSNETIKCESINDFNVYYLNRQNLQGGGVALGVTKELKSTLVNEGDDETEAISVKVFVKEVSIRVVAAYGPQENALKEKKEKFWQFLDKEATEAELEGDGFILQMDGNLHAGNEIIKEDPNMQNKNGKLFSEFLERNPNLIVVNSLDVCEGRITRKRTFENKIEQAVLDFFIINGKMRSFVRKMIIDEKRQFNLINLAQLKKNSKFKESDHNSLILDLKINCEYPVKRREEMLNLRNERNLELFRKETEQNQDLLNCFEMKIPFEKQSKKWKYTFENILKKCFNKVRIVKKKNQSKTEKLLIKRAEYKNEEKKAHLDDEMRAKINLRIKQIEKDIGDEVAQNNFNDIVETMKEIGDKSNIDGAGRRKMWDLLKKKFPKSLSAVPVGKRDRTGKMVTEHTELKHLYLKTYKLRMRNRPMKEELSDVQLMKNQLFETRLRIASQKKSKPWDLNDLEAALKSLKTDKARDPHGWVNELFKDGIAGRNLKLSLLCMFNKMKETNKIPEYFRLADISTIYKGRGAKTELINERGIFVVTILRSILMKLIYFDYYAIIDKSMSDSQIGARKNKNIRNHIWIVNGIITDVLSSKSKKSIDIQIYDYKQCFDSLWIQECLNDFYNAGLNDDKFALLYNMNKNVKIAVKTPIGKTSRETITDVVIQGDVFGPLMCSKQIDTFGQECLDKHRYTYMYRGEVEIPPLSMIDDLLAVSECGFKTTMSNAYLALKTDIKKLQFGAAKCKKLHIGKCYDKYKCQDLKVDKWEELEIKSSEELMDDIKDVWTGSEVMEEKCEEKYLGEVISADGKNIKNVKARVAKGKGIITRIIALIEGIPFGKFYFQVAMILRESLLISSMIFNSEAWYNVTKPELELLESVDLQFLRRILNAPKSTPKEMLFLETGCVPFREIIRKRRILFLHYILNEKSDSIMRKFLEKQIQTKKKKDWISQVIMDLKELNLNITIDNIRKMKKSRLKIIINQAIKEKTFCDMVQKKESHSKVRLIKHERLEMQNYLKPNELKVKLEEAQEIFKMRSRVSDVKTNFKGKYENFECEICKIEYETQQHIIECKEINKNRKEEKIIPKYEELFKRNVKNQVTIVRHFLENMKLKKTMEK